MARTQFHIEQQIRKGLQNNDSIQKEEPLFCTVGCVISHRCYYRYNINHPEIRRFFRAYCKKYKITVLPCSDRERFQFERDMDRHLNVLSAV